MKHSILQIGRGFPLAFMLPALWIACPLAAEDVPTPTELSGGNIVSADAAKRLLDSGNDVAIFDMRKAMNYGKGHIPGAVSMPYKQKSAKVPEFDPSVDRVDLSKLPADKARTLLFYSDGPRGWKSYKAAVLAIRHGYARVNWMREGMKVWGSKGYPLE